MPKLEVLSMRCIFCKLPSAHSKSKEHIIPESLGNTEHVLPPGWVCDSCNNYIARKVEAPFLESPYGQNSRFEMGVKNKKGSYTPGIGMHVQSLSKVQIRAEDDGSTSIFTAPGEDESRFVHAVQTHKRGTLILPAATLPPLDYDTCRFIAKIGLEVLAVRGMDIPEWNSELVDKIELDEIRDYVRRGRPNFIWPVHMRRIYPAEFEFSDSIDASFQILHEWDILFIDCFDGARGEAYAVIAIFGVEYVINLGGPELDGYNRWLEGNKGQSYLYSRK